MVTMPQGRGTGVTPAIVLIHGDFGDGFTSWGPACETIGRQRRTVIVDRMGFDVPVASGARFTIAGEARYLLEALVDVGIPSFHLVGHSYGALIALEMAITCPERVRSLHLIEPPLLDLLPEQPLVQEMDRRVRWIVERHAEIGDEAATEAFFSMIGADRGIERMRGTPDWDRLCGYAGRFAQGEPAGDYPAAALERLAVGMRTGLYTGGRSHSALRSITAELANRIDGAHLVEVPEAGHAVQMSGTIFVDALLTMVRDADLAWDERASVASSDPAEESHGETNYAWNGVAGWQGDG